MRKKPERALTRILSKASSCSNRAELESVLGKPRYAVCGNQYAVPRGGVITDQPERAEVYCVSGCTVTVLFYKDGRREFVGQVTMTAADFVLLIRASSAESAAAYDAHYRRKDELDRNLFGE